MKIVQYKSKKRRDAEEADFVCNPNWSIGQEKYAGTYYHVRQGKNIK